jgi:hypothetical protein
VAGNPLLNYMRLKRRGKMNWDRIIPQSTIDFWYQIAEALVAVTPLLIGVVFFVGLLFGGFFAFDYITERKNNER